MIFNPYESATIALDDGYKKAKKDMLEILDKYLKGPWDTRTINLLYDIKKEIEEL